MNLENKCNSLIQLKITPQTNLQYCHRPTYCPYKKFHTLTLNQKPIRYYTCIKYDSQCQQ